MSMTSERSCHRVPSASCCTRTLETRRLTTSNILCPPQAEKKCKMWDVGSSSLGAEHRRLDRSCSRIPIEANRIEAEKSPQYVAQFAALHCVSLRMWHPGCACCWWHQGVYSLPCHGYKHDSWAAIKVPYQTFGVALHILSPLIQ